MGQGTSRLQPYKYDEASQPQASNEGQIVRGGAKGALLGAIGGAIGGNAGKGAKIGAAVGATSGLLKRPRNNIAQQDARQQIQASAGGYERSDKVCLRGRGYEAE